DTKLFALHPLYLCLQFNSSLRDRGCECQRHEKHDVIVIDVAGQAGACRTFDFFFRQRPLNRAGGHTSWKRPVDLRWRAGVATILPIGVPALVHPQMHSGPNGFAGLGRLVRQDETRGGVRGLRRGCQGCQRDDEGESLHQSHVVLDAQTLQSIANDFGKSHTAEHEPCVKPFARCAGLSNSASMKYLAPALCLMNFVPVVAMAQSTSPGAPAAQTASVARL